jgi:nicotinate-nucleotide adenylyltransferase
MSKFSLIAFDYHKKYIGLLGGSFNPPHNGHIEISVEAMKRLNLNRVIWLITPQNPHKSADIYMVLEDRIRKANKITKDYNYITVSNFESEIRSRYTYNTVKYLQNIHPNIKFIWIMGADNLSNMMKWYRYKDLINIIDFAVFDRDPYSYEIIANKIAVNCNRMKFF